MAALGSRRADAGVGDQCSPSPLIPGTELVRLQSSERTAGQAPNPLSDPLRRQATGDRRARPAPPQCLREEVARRACQGLAFVFLKLRRMKGTL